MPTSPTAIAFTIFGHAKPAGSKRGFVINGRAVLTDANPNSREWKNQVADAASQAYRGDLLDCPLRATFRFYKPRPKGHFNSKGELNKEGLSRPFPTSAPDALKLGRGVEDAMKGVIYRDDALIVQELLEKHWGQPARCEVEIERLT